MLQDIIKNIWGIIKKLTSNATFAAIAGCLVGLIIGNSTTSYQLHDAITYDNISSYIDDLMVTPGLISEEILSLENPFEQLSMITDIINNQQSTHNKTLAGLQKYLISIGEQKLLVETCTDNELLDILENTAESILEIKEENKRLTATVDYYSTQKTATLSNPKLEILGENLDTSVANYMATIDGHIYFSEDLLNTFLPETIVYKDNVILYGQGMPEKINVVDYGLLYDNSNFISYNGNSHFTMSNHDYSNGIAINAFDGGTISISCDGNYSTLSLIPGHIDNTPKSERTLKISYRGANGNFNEALSISLYGDMPIEPISIPIYNTETVKIEMTYGGSPAQPAKYGLADIYLIK